MNHQTCAMALRARALPLSVATTGVTTLEATATGFARASGNFITDGFVIGFEVTPVGFTDSTPDVITDLTALTLTTRKPRVVDAAAPLRALTVGLPALRGWENVALEPISGRWWIEEDYVPATNRLLTSPQSGGRIEDTGLYILRVYGVENVGSLAINQFTTALLARYPAGAGEVLTDGTELRIRADVGPSRGQNIHDAPGATVVSITVPFRAYSLNPV